MTAAIAAPQATLRDITATQYAPAAARSRAVDRGRSALFVEFVRAMNAAGIPYCLLSGYESYPLASDSDVDFMVRPEDSPRITPLLREVASRCDALLVQAIQHETTGCYYVLAKQVGNEVAYLHPDCTADYRRNGRLWLVADQVIRGRRRLGTFFVPAVADEFQYYLIKKILKQQITKTGFQRIAALYIARPEECCERLRRFWTKETTARLVSVLVRHDFHWIQLHLCDLLDELYQSTPQENCRLRAMQLVREWRRRINRVSRTTGLGICVCGGKAEQRSELSAQVERNLRPAFRRTEIITEERSSHLPISASARISKVKSTLIIRKSAAAAKRWNTPNEICFDLSDKGHLAVETATRSVLEAMAKRLQGHQV